MKIKSLSLLLFLIFNCICFCQDTISSKYFPLNVGNKWIYRIHTSLPPFDPYRVYQITKDTIISGHKYFYYTGQYEWIRYDSLSGNLLSFSANDGCSIYPNDKIIDSLPSQVNDVVNCFYSGFITRRCSEVQPDVKKFIHDGLATHTIIYTKNIGRTSLYHWEVDPNFYDEYLQGYIIDGIVYGDTNLTSVNQTINSFPDNFSLSQNYPNPFNPTTNLEFGISSARLGGDLGFVSLKIYDVLGNEVGTLVNEKKAPGNYSVQFDGSNFSSGIYFYKLTAGDFSETKRMILLK